jgi:heavy metal sensor kinase
MKSIRLALIVYFLVLLGVALTFISTIVYQTSHESLLAKKAIDEEHLYDRYKENSRDERDKLNKSMSNRAQFLADLVRNPWAFNEYRQLYIMGVLSAAVSPQGQVQVPAWLAEVTPGPVAWEIVRNSSPITFPRSEPNPLGTTFPLGSLSAGGSPTGLFLAHFWTSPRLSWDFGRLGQSVRVRFRDDVLPGNGGGRDSPYCQLTGPNGEIWQSSRSLHGKTLELPPNAADIRISQWVPHEMKLKPDVNVRILTVKTPLPGFAFGGGRPRGWRGPGPGGRMTRASAPNRAAAPPGPPFFFIQYARDTGPRDAALARFRAERNKDVERLQDEVDSQDAALRYHLLRISLFTFGATILGGFWIVRLGLSPLRRLTDAVSKVSVKDFRLPMDDRRLPSELKPIVARLTQTLDMLKRAFAREKQAAADISHELRTPLSALLTTIQVALRKPRAPEEYRELLADCQASGTQMYQLVERLLALARLDAGVDNLRPRDVDVTELAEQCAALVRPLAEARGLHLRVHGNGPAHTTADPDKLREVLTNLLHNAIQYNRPEGSIDLIVQRDNGDLRVEVRDTGIGIPDAAREHIFERFYRADPSRQADGLHAGLGLAIVKGYIDLMGGSIGVESAEGHGSTFRVQLPITEQAPAAGKVERSLTVSKN